MSGVVNIGGSLPLTTGSAQGAGGTPSRASPELAAQLNTSRAQLADWVTCASAKTPEGKAKIAQISAKVDALKEQINASAKAAAADAPKTASPVNAARLYDASATPSGINRPSNDPDATLGRHLDLFA